MVLDFGGPTGTRTVAQAVKAGFQVALHRAPDDLPIDRQAGADLVHLETVCRKQHDTCAQHHEVLSAASTHEHFQSLPRLPVECDPMLRYSAYHPSFSSGFVERQLDSAGERTGASAYFHRLGKAIVTFGTQH